MNKKIFLFFVIFFTKSSFSFLDRLTEDTQDKLFGAITHTVSGVFLWRYGPMYRSIIKNHKDLKSGISTLNGDTTLYDNEYPSPETDAIITGAFWGAGTGELRNMCVALQTKDWENAKSQSLLTALGASAGALFWRYGPPYKTVNRNHFLLDKGNLGYMSPEYDALATGALVGVVAARTGSLLYAIGTDLWTYKQRMAEEEKKDENKEEDSSKESEEIEEDEDSDGNYEEEDDEDDDE